jgi:hypothetical protein
MASVAPITFVLRPNGSACGNVFVDWPSLMSALRPPQNAFFVEGRKVIEFDDSLEPTGCVIPPVPLGQLPYDMQDVMWTGFGPRAGKPRSVIRIQEGARFSNLRMIGGQITIVNEASTISPISDFSENLVHQVQIGLREDGGNAQLINPGAAPLFDLGPPNANKKVFFFIQNTLVGIGAIIEGQSIRSEFPLIGNDGGVDCTLNFIGQNQTGERLVRGGGVRFGALSSSTQIGADNAFAATPPAANKFAPVTRIQRKVQPHPPRPPARSHAQPPVPNPLDGELGRIDLPNTLLRCDGNGADGSGFEVRLPHIKSGFTFSAQLPVPLYTGGQEIVVAEVAGGDNLRVRAAAGNTIDGATEPVRIRAGESRIFASDGESNWITIASDLNPPSPLNPPIPGPQLALRMIQAGDFKIDLASGTDFEFDLPGLSGPCVLHLNVKTSSSFAFLIQRFRVLVNGEEQVSGRVKTASLRSMHRVLTNAQASGNALRVDTWASLFFGDTRISVSDVFVIYQTG